jgi:DNA primase large subunit
MTARFLPRLDEDSRLVPILTNLSQGFLAGVPSEWSTTADKDNFEEIKAEMVDDMSRKHFPMCMRHLHESLRRDHHLKHFGRLQYGLFLKASKIKHSFLFLSTYDFIRSLKSCQVLGLSIDEAISFWRRSFSSITDDKFNKEYKYNIRHSFGLEGKRANYAAKRFNSYFLEIVLWSQET